VPPWDENKKILCINTHPGCKVSTSKASEFNSLHFKGKKKDFFVKSRRPKMSSSRIITRSMSSVRSGGRVFLGFDSSTQGIKATAVSEEGLKVVASFAVNYQSTLGSKHALVNGVHARPGNVVTQPTLLYVEALELLLEKMRSEGFDFGKVAAVSGSGQQHGSVYWKKGASATLGALSKTKGSLVSQLSGAFALKDSPIWMDSSTGAQCAALEKALGGAQKVADATGSRAYERFTGNQIAKVSKEFPDAFQNTERISLISSAMCSVLLGGYAPIDRSDGCGMNALDLRSFTWHKSIMPLLGPNAEAKLGPVTASHSVVGKISPFFVESYRFAPDCKIVAWSGDNPCSVAGLSLRNPGDIAVSLGTSDTMFGITAKPTPGIEGHIFANPVDPNSYMAMLCYKNGSLTRERIRDATSGGSWEKFNEKLAESAIGNNGKIGFYVDNPEITPALKAGVYRFGADGKQVKSFTPSTDVRAVLEGQFLSMRVHGESVGLTNPKRVIATGGASNNAHVLQVLSDVLGAKVYVASQSDSASLGAAFRAAHGYFCEVQGKFVPFEAEASLTLAASPRTEAYATYTKMLPAYRAAEQKVLSL
jgi:xylulokinase